MLLFEVEKIYILFQCAVIARGKNRKKGSH
jgi:hypothetical protein